MLGTLYVIRIFLKYQDVLNSSPVAPTKKCVNFVSFSSMINLFREKVLTDLEFDTPVLERLCQEKILEAKSALIRFCFSPLNMLEIKILVVRDSAAVINKQFILGRLKSNQLCT